MKTELEEIKDVLNDVLDELESKGSDVSGIREKVPGKSMTEPEPPWVRDGYDDKRTWLQEKGE